MSPIVVYDTMVFLQAAARPERNHATLRAVADGRVTLCLSRDLIDELRDVLTRGAVRARFPALAPDAVDAFLAELVSQGTMFDPVPAAFTWPHHPDDDHVFNLAIHARANYLVTWETRMLELGAASSPAAVHLRTRAPQLAIVTPAALAAVLRLTP